MSDTPAPPVWSQPPEAVLSALDTGPKGLSAAEAERRLAEHGPNRLPEAPRVGPLRRLLRHLSQLLILVLIVAAAITAALGHWIDTWVILAVVIANTAIGMVQEGRAEAALAALRDMLAPRAAVRRDGRRQTVAGSDLVPGDLVLIEAGDRVPADLRLIDLAGLTVDEAILTGESVPVRKTLDPVAEDAPLGERLPMLFSGTLVAAGTASGIVTATGSRTEIGRINTLLGTTEQLVTPLVRQMNQLARWLAGFIGLVAAGLLALTILVRDMAFAEAFMIVVGLFVAAIPEGLPALLTVTLAIGVQAMARRHAIVRRLPAIETLGAVSVICSDKTGTLTRNEMMVRRLVTGAASYEVTGEGYAPEGALREGEGEAVDAGADPLLVALAEVAARCNDASLVPPPDGSGKPWRVEGDPMEGALLAFAAKAGATLEDAPDPIARIPFDAAYRYMAVLMPGDDAGAMALVKGAPEAILSRADTVAGPDGPQPIDAGHWHDIADRIAADGMRVLALARKPVAGSSLDHGDIEEGLELLGLVGLIDPPRPEAIRAVADCRSAGIDVKMITGDHATTARAIAAQIGLARTDRVLTGVEIDRLDDEALIGRAAGCDVFARTSPEHKLRLVTALQARGAVVAMTGDGVNDAPALRRADVGIAMGQKGSEAAREASEFVLTDDNFASIAEAVRQGRAVYANLKKIITFILPVNGGESLGLVIAVLFGLMLPITPLQILWVNMVSSVALAAALAFERPEADIMRRPPRRSDAPILSRFILWRIALVSLLFSAGIFGQFALTLHFGGSVEMARTMAVNTLVAMEVFYLFSVRYRHGSPFSVEAIKGTPAVLLAVAVVIVLQGALTYLPPFQVLFQTVALSPLQILQCTAFGLVLLVVLEFDRRAAGFWKRGRA